MTLNEKLKAGLDGILLYGMTPPKITNDDEKIATIASKALERIKDINIDGIVLYDIQDESDRTSQDRTFSYIPTISPQEYFRKFFKGKTDAVLYQAVGKYNQDELNGLISALNDDEAVVFVGASSKHSSVLTRLNEAYKLYANAKASSVLGGISIPERHSANAKEHFKIAGKIAAGCEFFITQAVYDVAAAKKLIDDYASLNIKKVPIIFTFTPCGSDKTLEFMRWLGISVPDFLASRLQNSDDMLLSSTQLCFEMFKFLRVYGRLKGIAVGANVESISTRRVEIEAAVELAKNIAQHLGK